MGRNLYRDLVDHVSFEQTRSFGISRLEEEVNDEQSLSNEPGPESETAAHAFARLGGRIAMTFRAVENLAAERANIDAPDYGATLGQMNTRLVAIAQGLADIAEKPAILLTPEALAARMDAAAEKSRRTESAALREARESHQEAARIIRDLTGAVREQREQLVRLSRAWGSGVVARALLEGWHMSERMARHMVCEPTL